MHTLAFVNQKGGCGKTTTAVQLAVSLARRDRSVLLVDLDPQAHATLAFGQAVDEREGDLSIADVLLDGRPLAHVLRPVAGGVALAPGALALAEFEEVAERLLHSERFLARALEGEPYDLALIDCPPRADGVLTANALRASETAVLVVETGAFALQGALRAVGILEQVARRMAGRFALRVVGTLFDRRQAIARELLIGTQARFGARMFDTVIHESVRLREAAALGVPVQLLEPGGPAARDFDALAEEVLCHVEREAGVESAPEDAARSPLLEAT